MSITKLIVSQIRTRIIFIELAFIWVLAFTLRIINLEFWPRWYTDEGALGLVAENIGKGLWGYETWGPNFFPPVQPLLSTLMLKAFGKNFFALRLPGAILGSISPIVLYLIGKRLFGHRVAIIATLILTVISIHINRIPLKANFAAFFLLLTVLSYLKFKDNGRQGWVYFAGISTGLAFLSRYEGVVGGLFLLFQSIVDKNLRRTWMFFPIACALALISPLIGVLIDWNSFLFDTLVPFILLSNNPFNLKDTTISILFANYSDQLGYTASPISYIWSIAGVASTLYLLFNKGTHRKFIVVWFISLLPIFLMVSSWWAYLVEIYPFYSLTIATTLYRIINPLSDDSRKNKSNRSKPRFKSLIQLLLVSILLTIVSSAMILEIVPTFNTYHTWDQRAIVEWINMNLKEEDRIAASFPIVFKVSKGEGVPYQDVVLYTTHRSFCEYREEMLPRYRMNVSIETIDFFIIDTPLYGFEPGKDIAEMVKAQWLLVYEVGDYKVYRSPRLHG